MPMSAAPETCFGTSRPFSGNVGMGARTADGATRRLHADSTNALRGAPPRHSVRRQPSPARAGFGPPRRHLQEQQARGPRPLGDPGFADLRLRRRLAGLSHRHAGEPLEDPRGARPHRARRQVRSAPQGPAGPGEARPRLKRPAPAAHWTSSRSYLCSCVRDAASAFSARRCGRAQGEAHERRFS